MGLYNLHLVFTLLRNCIIYWSRLKTGLYKTVITFKCVGCGSVLKDKSAILTHAEQAQAWTLIKLATIVHAYWLTCTCQAKHIHTCQRSTSDNMCLFGRFKRSEASTPETMPHQTYNVVNVATVPLLGAIAEMQASRQGRWT